MSNKTNNDQLQTVQYDVAVAASKEYFAGDDLAAQKLYSKPVSEEAMSGSLCNQCADLLA